ncbi:hypothetical protein [Rhodococcus tibetensis]|uniref:Uncharacterized protein n=1 Tax=Rhodococcus tibetensis TaxID=2965064 RepID=A0ABT1QDW4_9NOCA|nr:hypothetical protein [Rhodococcus sp. FXJ9.536]MCQ4120446.1 hypothetical protein [Rhodococcus sp. FXJ9.536]
MIPQFTYRTEPVSSDAAVEVFGIRVAEPCGQMTHWQADGLDWADVGRVYVRTSGEISIVPFVGADERMLGVLRGTAAEVWRGEEPTEATGWGFFEHETGNCWTTIVSVVADPWAAFQTACAAQCPALSRKEVA